MVLEKLGKPLYNQLQRYRLGPFRIERMHDYAFQLLERVNFLRNPTHMLSELKPENFELASWLSKKRRKTSNASNLRALCSINNITRKSF